MKCWICGDEDAATREHLAKASDLKLLFGKPSQQRPLYFSANHRPGKPRRRNVRIGSLKSDTLKFAHRICLTCNSKRTQPYDYAWEHCSRAMRAALPRLLVEGSVTLIAEIPTPRVCGATLMHDSSMFVTNYSLATLFEAGGLHGLVGGLVAKRRKSGCERPGSRRGPPLKLSRHTVGRLRWTRENMSAAPM